MKNEALGHGVYLKMKTFILKWIKKKIQVVTGGLLKEVLRDIEAE